MQPITHAGAPQTRARLFAALLLGLFVAAGAAQSAEQAAAAPKAPAAAAGAKRPDLSGYWMLMREQPKPDPKLLGQLSPGAVRLEDTGVWEYPIGEYGGLKVKPAALEAAARWRPEQEMTVSKACQPPSLIYAMQGPFPIQIHQGRDLIVMQLEYYDLVRVIFMDGRKPPGEDFPHTKMGYSIGHWEGDTLVVETTHVQPATITNNGLEHSEKVRVIERFRLSSDGQTLLSTQEFADPEVLESPGARFVAWQREDGHIFPYDCDPSFAENYNK